MKRPSRTKVPGTAKATTNSLSDLLHTNLAPTPADILMVQQGIQAISDKVKKLQSKIEDLIAKRELHYGVLAPIRHVPTDVLQEIMHFVPGGALRHTKLVCQAWNAASPLIRSSTGISKLKANFQFQAAIPSQRIRTWIDRAQRGRTALDIQQLGQEVCPCLNPSTRCSWADPGFFNLFKNVTLPPDLQVTFMPSSASCYLRFLDALEQVSTPSNQLSMSTGWNSLTSLSLDFRGSLWNGEVGAYRNLFNGLPNTLSDLDLRFPELFQRQPAPIMDISAQNRGLQSLTSLSLECPWDSPLALSLLRQCINLRKLSLDLNVLRRDPYTWTDLGTPITLHSLHTLSLRTHTAIRCCQFLSNYLHLPSLQHLAIAENVGKEYTLYEVLHSLRLLSTRDSAGRHHPPASCARLLTLTAKNMECNAAVMHEIFGGGLKYLEALVLDDVEIDIDELSRMLWEEKPKPIDGARQVIVPRLKVLELRKVRSYFLDVRHLLQYLSVRHNRSKRHATAFRTGPQLSFPQAITPQRIVVQYQLFHPNEALCWGSCVGEGDKLKRDCGVFLERMVSCNEMLRR